MFKYSRVSQTWLVLVIAMVVLALTLLGFRLLGFLTTTEALDIFLLGSLVLVTAVYARETANISRSSEKSSKAMEEQAKATGEMADANRQMAEEMRKQTLTASQPLVWPTIWGIEGGAYVPSSQRLAITTQNLGNGPALELDISLSRGDNTAIGTDRPFLVEVDFETVSCLAAGDQNTCHLRLGALEGSKESLLGKFTLLVSWRDIYGSGPFFQAVQPFKLEDDPSGNIRVNEGLVNIERIGARKARTFI